MSTIDCDQRPSKCLKTLKCLPSTISTWVGRVDYFDVSITLLFPFPFLSRPAFSVLLHYCAYCALLPSRSFSHSLSSIDEPTSRLFFHAPKKLLFSRRPRTNHHQQSSQLWLTILKRSKYRRNFDANVPQRVSPGAASGITRLIPCVLFCVTHFFIFIA